MRTTRPSSSNPGSTTSSKANRTEGGYPIAENTYTFDGLEELYDVAETLPEAERHPAYGHHEELDEWAEINWRDSVWLDDGRLVGDVSSSEDWYNVIQYGEILEGVGNAVEQYDGAIDVEGQVSISGSGHKMTGKVDFYGDTTIEPVEGDEINLGLKVRSGHSGFHGLKYDVGAYRQVCSNGMMAFVSDMHVEQSHQDPYNPGLAHQAVDAVVEGADEVEQRLEDAQEREFQNYDEALLVLMDTGIDQYFDEPVETFRDALDEEVDGDVPSLYDTYNAATRALTHYVEDDIPQYALDNGYEDASQLLDYGNYGLPDADYLGEQAVENRADQYINQPDETDPYWDGERETVRDLRQAYAD